VVIYKRSGEDSTPLEQMAAGAEPGLVKSGFGLVSCGLVDITGVCSTLHWNNQPRLLSIGELFIIAW